MCIHSHSARRTGYSVAQLYFSNYGNKKGEHFSFRLGETGMRAFPSQPTSHAGGKRLLHTKDEAANNAPDSQNNKNAKGRV
jgi:hypothetical protein